MKLTYEQQLLFEVKHEVRAAGQSTALLNIVEI